MIEEMKNHPILVSMPEVAPVPSWRSPTIGQLAAAKARAQAKFLPIGRDKVATVQTRAGGSYSYSYADLATCLEALIPALSGEGLALFQPVRIEDGQAVAMSLLVHGESGEWISGEYAMPILDSKDPRSIASATTYARRYGVTGLLGVASSDEDDDAETARGGQHEQARGGEDVACPACGNVGSLIKGRPEFGGGWVCWKKEGGCGMKWPEGPRPTAPPPMDPETEYQPRKKAPSVPPAAQSAGLPTGGGPVSTEEPKAEPPAAKPKAPTSRSKSEPERGQAATAAPREPAKGTTVPPATTSAVEEEPPHPAEAETATVTTADGASHTTFTIQGTVYTTNGITAEQMVETFKLVPAADRKMGTGYSRTLAAKMLGVPKDTKRMRELMTEEQAARYIAALEQAVA